MIIGNVFVVLKHGSDKMIKIEDYALGIFQYFDKLLIKLFDQTINQLIVNIFDIIY